MSEVFEVKFEHTGRGMFSIVNDVVDHLYVAEQNKHKLNLLWVGSPYKQVNNDDNAFEYYFENFFDIKDTDIPVGKKESFAFRVGNCITPRKNGLAQPTHRVEMNRIIDRYIKLKPHIRHKIDQFAEQNFNDYTIGLHIRGKGRTDGNASRLREKFQLVDGVPYDAYFTKVNQLLETTSYAKIFLCSDSQIVIDYCKRIYGDRIVTYSATRSNNGEMHRDRKYNDIKYKLGEDVLIEAYLLSLTDYLVHGSSNVTNYVLCKNSMLKNFYIYGDG
tara:strand:- start:7519 stop:8340 length:822 start_codon:yes stop_codon:yes gene_type:complete